MIARLRPAKDEGCVCLFLVSTELCVLRLFLSIRCQQLFVLLIDVLAMFGACIAQATGAPVNRSRQSQVELEDSIQNQPSSMTPDDNDDDDDDDDDDTGSSERQHLGQDAFCQTKTGND